MKTKPIAALPAMMILAAATHGASAVPVPTDPKIKTSMQVLSAPGETLIIESDETVTTPGDAVRMEAPDQTLVNRGTIEAMRGSGHGVVVAGPASRARVLNYGSISTNGTSGYGLNSTAPHTQLLNFGDITTYGECSYGVYGTGDHFSVTNNGRISTRAGANSHGVFAEFANHATIVNNGAIDTIGDTANGIVLHGSHANITNNGRLTTSGANAIGIYAWHTTAEHSHNVLTNNGTIRATGAGSQAIYANATGMTVINSGRVSSSQSEAFFMGQANQTLTLLPGSVIEGGIRFDQPGSATLNIGRGLDATLTLDGIPGTIDTNGQAYVLNGNVLAVVSPDVIGAGGTAASVASGAISSAVRGHVDRSRQRPSAGGPAPLAYGPTSAASAFPNFAPSEDFRVWTTAYGAFSSPRGGTANVRSGQGGGLFGFETRLSDETLGGLFVGFGDGFVRTNHGFNVDTTTLVGGGYGSFGFGAAFVDVNAAFGTTFNKSERTTVNNTSASGLQTVNGDYRGYFFSPSLTVGVDHNLGAARLTPSVSLFYAGIHQNGYTETGSAANLRLGSQTTHVLTARGEIELGTLKLDDMPGGWSAAVKVGGESTFVDGSTVNVSLLDSTISFAGSSSTETRGFVGVDFGFAQGGYDFSAKGEVGYDTAGALSASIQGGIGMRF